MKKYKEYWKCVWRDKETVSGSGFTVNKVYERINGVLVDDDGFSWSKHPINMNTIRFEQVDENGQTFQMESNIGVATPYLSVNVGNNKTFITYGENNKRVEKVIDREVTEDELFEFVKQLESKSVKHLICEYTKANYLICEDTRENYGILGTKTNLTDTLGRELFVGDVVEIFYDGKEKGRAFVVCDEDKCFVMGIKAQTPENDFGFKTQKVKSYKDVLHNEKYGFVKAV